MPEREVIGHVADTGRHVWQGMTYCAGVLACVMTSHIGIVTLWLWCCCAWTCHDGCWRVATWVMCFSLQSTLSLHWGGGGVAQQVSHFSNTVVGALMLARTSCVLLCSAWSCGMCCFCKQAEQAGSRAKQLQWLCFVSSYDMLQASWHCMLANDIRLDAWLCH